MQRPVDALLGACLQSRVSRAGPGLEFRVYAARWPRPPEPCERRTSNRLFQTGSKIVANLPTPSPGRVSETNLSGAYPPEFGLK